MYLHLGVGFSVGFEMLVVAWICKVLMLCFVIDCVLFAFDLGS